MSEEATDLHGYKFTEDHEDRHGTNPDSDVAIDDSGRPTTTLLSMDRVLALERNAYFWKPTKNNLHQCQHYIPVKRV
jgi:hypothetical protein